MKETRMFLKRIDKKRWLDVVKRIKPDQTYTPQGFPPNKEDKAVVFGSELARKGARGWILHTSLAEGVQAVEAMKAEAGVQTVNEHARQSGVKTLELKSALRALRGGSSVKVGELRSDQHPEIEQALQNGQEAEREI